MMKKNKVKVLRGSVEPVDQSLNYTLAALFSIGPARPPISRSSRRGTAIDFELEIVGSSTSS